MHNENFGRNQNEQIVIAARNFPKYLEAKASHLSDWKQIKHKMLRFVALWVVSHMAFLHNYYKKLGQHDNSLLTVEKQVFQIDFIRNYKFKYFLKKNFPFVHDLLVKIKKLL